MRSWRLFLLANGCKNEEKTGSLKSAYDDPKHLKWRELAQRWLIFSWILEVEAFPDREELFEALGLYAELVGGGTDRAAIHSTAPNIPPSVVKHIAMLMRRTRKRGRGKAQVTMNQFTKMVQAVRESEVQQRRLKDQNAPAPYETALRSVAKKNGLSMKALELLRKKLPPPNDSDPN